METGDRIQETGERRRGTGDRRRETSILVRCVLLTIASVLMAFGQPIENGRVFRTADLVELIKMDSTIKLDVRYATANNFMKRRMYSQSRAFLQRPAAEALVRVHGKLKSEGYGLLVFDGYRPWSVTKQFWDETPPSKRSFVADPQKGSKHNRGCAVDLSLFNLKTGKEVSMPSAYDEFSERASPDYKGGSVKQKKRRDLLRFVMESEGFSVDPGEWWHFDYREWKEYGILDVPFEDLR